MKTLIAFNYTKNDSMKSGKWICFTVAILSLSMIGCDKKDEGADTRTNFTDSSFAVLASMVNVGEIAVSQVVADSSDDPAVVDYAEMMIADHTAAQQELLTVTGQVGLGTTNTISPENQQLINSLLTLKGTALDSLYMVNQVVAHEKSIDIYKNHGANGLYRFLKFYTNELLPVLTTHLQQARTLSEKY